MDPYKHRPSSGNNSTFWTTNSGAPVWNNNSALTVGQRGPILLEDYHLIEKLAQFDRERISEYVVHAWGASAKGFFEVTHDVSHLTCADFLQALGVQTPVIVRLSTIVHERGSPETFRDPLCFAVKFYTREPTPPAKTPRWSRRCSACPPDGGVGRQDGARPRRAILPQGQDSLAGRRRPGAPHLQRPRPHRRRAAGQDLPRLPAQVPLTAEATAGALRLWLNHPRPHPRARTAVTESR